MSKKTLLAAIKPFIRDSILKMTENENDDLPVFGHMDCFPYDAALLGEYRALCAEYKAERDSMASKKSKRKVKALHVDVVLSGPDGVHDIAEFPGWDGQKCAVFTTHESRLISICLKRGREAVTMDAYTAAALIPLLKRFVQTGRIAKSDDGEA